MNEFKDLEPIISKALDHARHDLFNSGHGGDYISEGSRCLDLARVNFQQALMWAVRSVAQPQSKL